MHEPTDPTDQAALATAHRSRAIRNLADRVIVCSLGSCGAISILTTIAILVVLFGTATEFFSMRSVGEFLLGTQWNPMLGAEKHFGVWPLVCGTLLVAGVAMAIAAPLGLITAIYLSEYAHPGVRAVLKPMLEVLAGIPTVVFGSSR